MELPSATKQHQTLASGGGIHNRVSISIDSIIVKASASISIITIIIFIDVIESLTHIVVILEHLVVTRVFMHTSIYHLRYNHYDAHCLLV